MTDESLLEELGRSPVVQISAEDLARLLKAGELLREEQTGMGSLLRLLAWSGRCSHRPREHGPWRARAAPWEAFEEEDRRRATPPTGRKA